MRCTIQGIRRIELRKMPKSDNTTLRLGHVSKERNKIFEVDGYELTRSYWWIPVEN